MATSVLNAVRRIIRRVQPPRRVARCVSREVRSGHDARDVGFDLAPAAHVEPAALTAAIRELLALGTPALFLNIVQHSGPVRVVLTPSSGRRTRFRGATYLVDAGAEAPEGVEAFLHAPLSHVTTLYPTAPDHPLYVISIENQGVLMYEGEFPSYLTHVTVVVNGVIVARNQRLLHERGPQVFWAA